MGNIIEINKVSKFFDKKVVLDDISFNVTKGKIFGLLGPSGAGKTTLVKIIAGIEMATSGEISMLGQKVPQLSLMKHIGYMAQADALYVDLTANENLNFFAQLYGLNKKRRKIRINAVLKMVNLTDDCNKLVRDFSGGMKRRLSLAIALLHEPDVLILDEPTVGIDPLLRKSIWDEFYRISGEGTPVIITTHVMDEAEHCDELGMIRDGQFIASGTPEQLKQQTHTNTLEEAFLTFGGVVIEN